MPTQSFQVVWRSLNQLEGSIVRTPVIERPNLIISFTTDGLIRRTCRPISQGGDWFRPGDNDWEDPKLVPIGMFRRGWNRLSRYGECEVSGTMWRIAAACFLAVPELNVHKTKNSPLTLEIKSPH